MFCVYADGSSSRLLMTLPFWQRLWTVAVGWWFACIRCVGMPGIFQNMFFFTGNSFRFKSTNSGRASNGKGHFWVIHPENLPDFIASDFHRWHALQALGRLYPQDHRKTQYIEQTWHCVVPRIHWTVSTELSAKWPAQPNSVDYIEWFISVHVVTIGAVRGNIIICSMLSSARRIRKLETLFQTVRNPCVT